MNGKIFLTVAAIAIYTILVTLYIEHRYDYHYERQCQAEAGCVRFCCSNSDTCNEDFIRENFLIPSSHDGNLTQQFELIYGKPYCSWRMTAAKETFEFIKVTQIAMR